MRLLGVSGVGKSFLLKEYQRRKPPYETQGRRMTPVAYVSLPAAPTQRGIYQTFLEGLGTTAFKGTSQDLRHRLQVLTNSCNVEMFLVDEVHHFVDRGNAWSYGAVADAMKELMDTLARPMVFAGAPRSQILFEHNMQLRSRVMCTLHMTPFDLELSFDEMRGYIYALCEEMELTDREWMGSAEVAMRLFFATDGIHRNIAEFLRLASAASAKASVKLDFLELAKVFTKYIWPTAADQLNPFHPEFLMRRLSEPGEPFTPSRQDGDNHASFITNAKITSQS